MSDAAAPLLREIGTLIGCRIEAVSRVAVTVASVQEELEQSLILTVSSEAGARTLQLLTDGYEPRARWMVDSADYVIEGEWSDREHDTLSTVALSEVPSSIERVVIVWQTIGQSATESLLALLIFEAQAPRMTIVFDNDDILVGPADRLWTYLGALLSYGTSVRMENLASSLSGAHCAR